MSTGIQYLDEVWNPITGCTAISPACDHCWARSMTKRLQGMGVEKYARGFDEVVCHDDVLAGPLKYKKPKVIGVCFMADLFHDDVGLGFIQAVFDVMIQTPRHSYVGLTKRAKNLSELVGWLDWPENLWMGVTVENREYKWRLDCLAAVPCRTWVSFEGLLGSIGVLHSGFDWAVIGCESGPGARHMETWWVEEIVCQCTEQGVKTFYKQAMIDGKLVSMPELYGVKHDYNAPAELLHEKQMSLTLCRR